jgi:hypothetical protein
MPVCSYNYSIDRCRGPWMVDNTVPYQYVYRMVLHRRQGIKSLALRITHHEREVRVTPRRRRAFSASVKEMYRTPVPVRY